MKKTESSSVSISPLLIGVLFMVILTLVAVVANAQSNSEPALVFIEGNVYLDADQNCGHNGNEAGLKGMQVVAKGKQTYFGKTDDKGNFTIAVTPGKYKVTVISTTSNIAHSECSDQGRKVALGKKEKIAQLSFPVTVEQSFAAAE